MQPHVPYSTPSSFRLSLEELPTLASLNAVLKNRSVLVGIECARAADLMRQRAVKSIEAVALDLGPDPKRRDAERAGTEGPEEATDRSRDEGTCSC